jgi:hypothetical protein
MFFQRRVLSLAKKSFKRGDIEKKSQQLFLN